MPLISVLLPTRGRPLQLRHALESLLVSPSRNFEVLVGCDADDPDLPEYGSIQTDGRAKWHIQSRFGTLADKVNSLAERAHGGLLFQFVNDMTIGDRLWVDEIMAAVDRHPEPAIFYSFVGQDEGKASLPILRREMVTDLGWFCPPWFPFWWSDSWMTELVRMSGRGVGIDLSIQHQDGAGGTQGLRDLAFWHHFFEATRPERVAYAAKLRGGPVSAALIEECEALSATNPNPESYEWYERVAAPIPQPGYAQAKAAAEVYLRKFTATP